MGLCLSKVHHVLGELNCRWLRKDSWAEKAFITAHNRGMQLFTNHFNSTFVDKMTDFQSFHVTDWLLVLFF